MAGLVPAIHAKPLLLGSRSSLKLNPVDGRHKAGHDGEGAKKTSPAPGTAPPQYLRMRLARPKPDDPGAPLE
jgi:hypothetical protein